MGCHQRIADTGDYRRLLLSAVKGFVVLHSKRSAPSGYITLKENKKIIKDQNQVAEILNSYVQNYATESLDIQQYTSFEINRTGIKMNSSSLM